MRLFWQLMVQELKLQTEDTLQRDAKYLARKLKDRQARILYGKFSNMLHRVRVYRNIQRNNTKDMQEIPAKTDRLYHCTIS